MEWKVSSLGRSPQRAPEPICAWSSQAFFRISSRPTKAPSTDGRSSLQTWRRSWRASIDARTKTNRMPLHKPKTLMNKRSNGRQGAESPSRLIDARIKELDDWRGETLARIRTVIKQADPEV